MLLELRVRNFALVEDVSLNFEMGMTVFTGETGAGKSLLLDAITLLLGAKARSDLVRSGSKSAEVEGVFDLSTDLSKRKLAENLGFEVDPDEGAKLLVRREISAEDVGRNRVWIQGRSATRAQLQALLGDWVEVSGQHEFLRLNRDDFILGLVDQFGSLREELKNFAAAYQEFSALERQLANLLTDERSREIRLDYLKFQIDELERSGICADSAQEEERLIALRARLGSLGKIRGACEIARAQVEGSDDGPESGGQAGLLTIVQNLGRELRPFASLDPDFAALVKTLDEVQTSSLELRSRLSDVAASLDADPEALEQAESQLSQMNRLKRRYNVDLTGLHELLLSGRRELENLSNPAMQASEISRRVEEKRAQLQKWAKDLHDERSRTAALIQKAWQKDLGILGMKQAKLQLEMIWQDELRSSGATHAKALFSANPGEPLRPLSKVASGGELSRILLSLKHIIAGQSDIGVYLFDEVDSGVGGETAHAVGSRLRSIAKANQVLVVTHLAQVAASAHQHFRIEKRVAKGRVQTFVARLPARERTIEIARMLGNTESKAAQSLARELVKKATLSIEPR